MEKMFTQDELNKIIEKRLTRERMKFPDKNEFADYYYWKDHATYFEHKYLCLKRGVPDGKTDQYLKIAETYLGETKSFEEALEMALKNFPIIVHI